MNTTDLIKTVDHAASMNDRWLFLAAFCLLLVLCAFVIHWLVKHLQSVLAEQTRERDSHELALEKIISTQNETALKLAVSLDRNTVALQDCSFELRRFKERILV